MKKIILSSVLAVALSSAPAHAFKLGAHGGLGFGSGSAHTGYESMMAPILGGEFTYGAGPADIGLFYDRLPLNPSAATTNDSTSFMGAVGRFTVPMAGYFFDGKLGMSKTNFNVGGSTDNALSFGVGVGTSIDLGPVVSLMPRVGYNALKVKVGSLSSTRTVIDLGVIVAVGF